MKLSVNRLGFTCSSDLDLTDFGWVFNGVDFTTSDLALGAVLKEFADPAAKKFLARYVIETGISSISSPALTVMYSWLVKPHISRALVAPPRSMA
jgi:hypothetical protein